MARPKKEAVNEESGVDQIDAILNDKQFKGLHLGSRSGNEIEKPDIITTSSFFFDQVLGGGFRAAGWGRFFAPPESGKTSQGLCWARNWQNFYGDQGMVVIFNAEGRVTYDLVMRSGIDTSRNRFRIIDTNKSDFIYTMIERLVANNDDDKRFFFLVDSTDACERTVDMEKNLGESEKIGGSATIMSAAGKRLSLIFNLKSHFLYMTSQVRDKVNTHGPGAGGTKPSGGNAPQFYSSLTGEIKKHWSDLKILENPSDPKSKEIGRLVNIKLEKTYNETTGQIVQIPVKYGKIGGIWREYEAMMMSQTWGFIEKSGAHYTFTESYIEKLKNANISLEEVKFHGERNLRDYFDKNQDLVNYVHKEMRELFNLPA